MAAATIDRDGIADAMPARVQEAITALEQTFDQVVQTRQRYEQTEADNVLHVNDIFGALGAPPKQPKDLIGPAHVALPGMDRPCLAPSEDPARFLIDPTRTGGGTVVTQAVTQLHGLGEPR
ncbi:MAG: hypothetical protein ACR2I1_00360, partial [Propionibacteriaceae bacterium]